LRQAVTERDFSFATHHENVPGFRDAEWVVVGEAASIMLK